MGGGVKGECNGNRSGEKWKEVEEGVPQGEERGGVVP